MSDTKLPPPAELAQQTLFTTAELAAYLRTTSEAIRARKARGEIPTSAIIQRSKNGRVLYKRAAIDRHYRIGGGK